MVEESRFGSRKEPMGDPQRCSASSDLACVCVCVCVSAGRLVTAREGRTDFREMLGGNGTSRRILSVHGPLPFSKCFPVIKPFKSFQ